MRLRTLIWSGCISLSMAVFVLPAAAATVHECVPGIPTAASYTWDFKGEANAIFEDVQSAAQQALYHADRLQSFSSDNELSWESHAIQWDYLKHDINYIGAKLCRLESIRRVVSPWQQREIDRIAMNTRLMANNAQDAIAFGNGNQQYLWFPTYWHYVNNLYNQAKSLTGSVDRAVEFTSVSKRYRDLRHGLGVRAAS